MKATICNVCKLEIAEANGHLVEVGGVGWDICDICFSSPIILSECRRTRTRKPAPKTGRPKGSRNKKVPEIPESKGESQ